MNLAQRDDVRGLRALGREPTDDRASAVRSSTTPRTTRVSTAPSAPTTMVREDLEARGAPEVEHTRGAALLDGDEPACSRRFSPSRTALRLTSSSDASVRSAGSAAPGWSSPPRMRSRSWSKTSEASSLRASRLNTPPT